MKNIISSAVVAMILTWLIYFGCIALGLSPMQATLIVEAISMIIILLKFIGITTSTTIGIALVAATAVVAVTTDDQNDFFAPIVIIGATLMVSIKTKEENKVDFWNVALIHFLLAVFIFIPIYLHQY